MRNTPVNEYSAKRRFSEDAGNMNIPIQTLTNQPQLIKTDQIQAVKINPEYLTGQGSARKMAVPQPVRSVQDQHIEPLTFKLQQKVIESQNTPTLGFGTRKTPLSGTTLNVPAFRPKYRKSSHDFVNDPSTNMFSSEIFVRPSEKGKDNTPKAPTILTGGLQGMARKIVAKQEGEVDSPLMKFKHTLLINQNSGDDLSKSAILGLSTNDRKQNGLNQAKGTPKLNNLDFFRHKPIIPTSMSETATTGSSSDSSPLSPPILASKGTIHSMNVGSSSEHNAKIDLFKRKVVIQADSHQNASSSNGQGVETNMPIKQSLSFKKADMRPNPSIGSQSMTPTKQRQVTRPPRKEDFFMGKKLGKGRFGDVFIVKHKQNGFICAMKVISKQLVKQQKFQEQLARELKLQGFMKHPNIASLYGEFDDQQHIYLLLELCADGHLQKILKEQKRLPQPRAKDLLRQICRGVEFLHRQGVLHRDLKPENVVMNEVNLRLIQGMAKLCDFGWAIHAGTGLRQTFCGTPLYVSPELLRGEQYDASVDAWAVGILAYEMLVGKTPFKVTSADDLGRIVIVQLIQITDELVFPTYLTLSSEAKDFLMCALQKKPAERMDLDEMLTHPFLIEEHLEKQPSIEFNL